MTRVTPLPRKVAYFSHGAILVSGSVTGTAVAAPSNNDGQGISRHSGKEMLLKQLRMTDYATSLLCEICCSKTPYGMALCLQCSAQKATVVAILLARVARASAAEADLESRHCRNCSNHSSSDHSVSWRGRSLSQLAPTPHSTMRSTIGADSCQNLLCPIFHARIDLISAAQDASLSKHRITADLEW